MENNIQPLKTLVSMTDFVCHIRSMTMSELCNAYPKKFVMPIWKGDQSEMVKDMLSIDAIKWDMTGEYMKFLKQPLTLSMFICVSEAGEVLEEPYNDGNNDHYYGAAMHEYRKAKDKILFEGFRVVKFPEHKIETLSNTEFLENDKGERVAYRKDWETDWYFDGETIEYLCGLDITLTPNALKLIYG